MLLSGCENQLSSSQAGAPAWAAALATALRVLPANVFTNIERLRESPVSHDPSHFPGIELTGIQPLILGWLLPT